MSIKELVVGGVITIMIGGTAYTVSQADVAKNFANDTGLTQQEAEEYVSNVSEDDLVSYDELGSGYISDGQTLITNANEIDCTTYEYGWESSTLTCEQGKEQLAQIANNEIALGESYKKLDSDSASKQDIELTIRHIDSSNIDFQSEIIRNVMDQTTIDDARKTNSYNKALLQAALNSN